MAAPADPPPPLRFPLRLAVLAVVVAVVQVGALAGLGYLGVTALHHDSTTGKLAEPVQLRPVTALHGAPCQSGEVARHSGYAHVCYRLGSGMTLTALKSIGVEHPADIDGWAIYLRLRTRDAAKFADLTGRLVGQRSPHDQLAIVVKHRIVSAPEVQAKITDGYVRIMGDFTQQQAQHLADQITG
jgi:SecD-like export protein